MSRSTDKPDDLDRAAGREQRRTVGDPATAAGHTAAAKAGKRSATATTTKAAKAAASAGKRARAAGKAATSAGRPAPAMPAGDPAPATDPAPAGTPTRYIRLVPGDDDAAGRGGGAAGGGGVPALRHLPRWLPLRSVLALYLTATFLLLVVVFALAPRHAAHPPGAPRAAPAAATWDYQRETIALAGRGLLNAYARGAVRATAWLARGSIERQRDVHRLNLLDYLAGQPAARALGRWRAAHQAALEGVTIALLVGLAAYGTLRRDPGRHWLAAVAAVLAATLLLTQPAAIANLAGQAGVQVPNLALRAAVQGDPSAELRGGTQQVLEELSSRYWTAFVAEPLSRLQTGTTVLATAPPTRKPGILADLRGKLSAVNDWAIGRHGPERALIATFAVLYVLPFALALCALAMLATCAQALLFLLLLGTLAVPALAIEPRPRRLLLRWWLQPLLATAGLLAGVALLSFLVVRAAELLHGADDQLGVLLAGSAWPALLLAVFGRRLARRVGAWRAKRWPLAVRGGAA